MSYSSLPVSAKRAFESEIKRRAAIKLRDMLAAEISAGASLALDQFLPLHDAQKAIYASRARFRVVVCGRRFGKTVLGGRLCVEAALQGKRVWWVAPDYPTAQIGWREIKKMVAVVRPDIVPRESEKLIQFSPEAWIQVKSAESQLKGDGLDLVVIDEAALVSEDAWIESLRPALSDREGCAVFISTPKGRNWFWRCSTMGYDPAQGEWATFNFPTAANPHIKTVEIEAARELMPERLFKQEYLAEFILDSGGVFRGVAEVSIGVAEAPQGKRYIAGIDWGKENDFTAISVFDVQEKRQVWLDRFNQISWELQKGRVKALHEQYQLELIIAEENSMGGPLIEALRGEGLPIYSFTTGAQNKGELIESLALGIEKREVTLLNDPLQITEFQAYEMDRLPSGRFRYGAPAGMHDDTVMAGALAWHGIMRGARIEMFDNPFFDEVA